MVLDHLHISYLVESGRVQTASTFIIPLNILHIDFVTLMRNLADKLHLFKAGDCFHPTFFHFVHLRLVLALNEL